MLGRIRGRALRGDPDSTAEQAMRPGPSTIRPDTELAEIVDYYGGSGLKSVFVTDPDGRLIGTLYLEDTRSIIDGSGTASSTLMAGVSVPDAPENCWVAERNVPALQTTRQSRLDNTTTGVALQSIAKG